MNQKFILLISLCFIISMGAYAQPEEEVVKLLADDGKPSDGLGSSVTLCGKYALVAASNENEKTGAVYVYFNNNGKWEQTQKLIAPDGAKKDQFGYQIDISEDFAIIGSWQDDDKGENSGSAYIFNNNAGTWHFFQKLVPSNGIKNQMFGRSVSISNDYALVGSHGGGGSKGNNVYIYHYNSGTWIEEPYRLEASDGTGLTYFGNSLDICNDFAIIGAYMDDEEAQDAGAAYVFYNHPDSGKWVEQQKLTANDAAMNDRFGNSVSIAGINLVIGAPHNNDNGDQSGSAYVYTNLSGTWYYKTKLLPKDGSQKDYFGSKVCIHADYALIGAYGDNDVKTNSGAAYLFKNKGMLWQEVIKFKASDADSADNFGLQVCVDSNFALIGASGNDDLGNWSGSAYIFGPKKVNLTTQPTNVNDVCPNSMVNFTIVAENADTYQWQTSTDNGLNWSDLSNDNTYSGTKSNTLGVKASTNLANNEFRCIAGNEYRGNEISETVHFNFESGKPVISSTHNDQILNADNEISLPNYKSSVVASDNCDASLTITQQPAPGNMISGATNEVTLTATDDAGNYSIVKFNVAVEDKTKPKVTLSTPKNLVNKSFVVTFAFSEAIVGLLGNDIITVNNGVVNNLSPVNNKTFTAEIAPTQTGKVFVSLKADKLKDENGNFNNASEVLIVNADMEGPAIKLSTVSSLVNAAFSVKIQFSEKVSNFEEDHITVTNGYVETGSLDSESDSIYTCVIVPTVIGTVSLHIGKEKVKDMVGNLNPKASSPLNVGFDPSSLNELSAYTGVEISPNPANSFIEIHIKEYTGLFTYAILDITGSMVKKNILNNKEKISINELPAGLYLLNIETDNMVISKRLVIQR